MKAQLDAVVAKYGPWLRNIASTERITDTQHKMKHKEL